MAGATHDPGKPSIKAMSGDLERIKQELLIRYESGAPIDIAEWTRRCPAHRDELIDFWMWLSGSPPLQRIDMTRPLDGDDRIAQEAVHDACLAVSFSRQNLNESLVSEIQADGELGAQLARIRQSPLHPGGRASKEFRRAVVYAWIVHVLGPGREQVTRLAAQKVAYLLEQALCLGLFTEHEEMPLGPYDPKAKYRDAEPIAERSGWIRVRGAILEPRQKGKLERYLPRYVRSEVIARQFVTRLGRLTDEQLETWSTVAWAGRALAAAGIVVTTDNIRAFLGSTPEWCPKLERDNFVPERITEAMVQLCKLQLLRV